MRTGGAIRAAAAAVLLCGAALAVVVDRIAVVVGDDVITESEVIEEVRMTEFLNGQKLDLSTTQRRAAADRLVDQQLIRDEMEVGNYSEPPDQDVDATLEQFRTKRFGGSDAALRASLQAYGLTESELKKHLRWQIAAVRFANARFQPGIPAAPAPKAGAPAGAAPKQATVEQLLDAWLKEKRSTTTIRMFKEAFE
jgi:parvulin-like peptidyl-prolyl isomerase